MHVITPARSTARSSSPAYAAWTQVLSSGITGGPVPRARRAGPRAQDRLRRQIALIVAVRRAELGKAPRA
ncbi:hypothetical protein AB0M43_23645 [Longispora sp. NPDC051575]|uniref:hypothetical protein n=1 Tax=Longispora sp. NPDC051575 TaxID=3154943 RepID=UPI00341A4138